MKKAALIRSLSMHGRGVHDKLARKADRLRELRPLFDKMRRNVPTGPKRHRVRTYQGCFLARDAVAWLATNADGAAQGGRQATQIPTRITSKVLLCLSASPPPFGRSAAIARLLLVPVVLLCVANGKGPLIRRGNRHGDW